MNFIEHIFGFAPDNGSGTMELVLVLVFCAAVMWIWSIHRTKLLAVRRAPERLPDSCSKGVLVHILSNRSQ